MRKETFLSPAFFIPLLLLCGCVLYSNTLHAPFYFDDYPSILFNPKIVHFQNWIDLLTDATTRFISSLSFAINYSVGGTSPFGYHIVNILIHLLNSVLVFAITRQLLATPAIKRTPPFSIPENLIALAAALIFMCHPLQTQAVTYIVQRITSMASLFYLATLFLYLRYRISKKRPFYLLGLITALLSTLSKEIAFTLPVALLLCEVLFFDLSKNSTPQLLKRLLPFLGIAFLIPGLLLLNHQHLVQDGGQMGLVPSITTSISRSTYLITQLNVVRTYLRLLILPVHQILDYDFPISSSFFTPETFASFVLILGILILGFRLVRRQPLVSFGIFFFFLTLSIDSSIIPFPDLIFEHRLYLPIAGFSILMASCLARGLRSSRIFTLVLVVLTLGLGTLTYQRNAVWADELAFWKDQTQKAPSKGRGFFHLGETYYKNHQYLLAADSFLKALQGTPLNRRSDINFNNLGSAYAQLDQIPRAEYWYRKGLEAYPKSGILYTSLAVLLVNKGDLENATSLLKKAIAVEPEPRAPIAYYELAHIHAFKGEYPQAIVLLEKAVTLDPFLRPAYKLLFEIYGLQGNTPAAVDALTKAAQIDPPSLSLYIQLGKIYCDRGQENAAILAFRNAIKAAPFSKEGYNALAYFYVKKGDEQKAIATLTEYLKFKKKHKLPLLK